MKCLKCENEVPNLRFCDQCGVELTEINPPEIKKPEPVETAVKTTVTSGTTKETMPDLLFNKYELIGEIGRGGMGIVYEAVDKTLDKKVAIKKMREELKINQREKKRFLREAKTVAKLHHPYIVDIYQIFEEKDDIYIVFEYIEGRSIEQILDEKGKLEIKEAMSIMKPVCEALGYAHREGVCHRDLKPSNIMKTLQGYVKVMDFGIARSAKESVSRISGKDTSGTLCYMAPEQHLGIYDIRSDIFSLGCTMYEIVTGELPYKGPDFYLQKEKMIYRLATEFVTGLPGKFDEVINMCLQAEKDKRYRTVQGLTDALGEL